MKNETNELGENIDPKLRQLKKQYDERMQECGGDHREYMRRYNRHTLNISVTDEQVGRERWEGKSITFLNEDNALAHLSLLSDLLDLLVKEENNSWGTGMIDDAAVQRILGFVKERIAPEARKGDQQTPDSLMPIVELMNAIDKEPLSKEDELRNFIDRVNNQPDD